VVGGKKQVQILKWSKKLSLAMLCGKPMELTAKPPAGTRKRGTSFSDAAVSNLT